MPVLASSCCDFPRHFLHPSTNRPIKSLTAEVETNGSIPRIEEHSIRVRLLNIRVLFSATAIVYGAAKILVLDNLLIRNVYKVIKLLKKIFSITENSSSFHANISLTNPKMRHSLLKWTHHCFAIISGLYDLVSHNEISRIAYESLGYGSHFQPFSQTFINKIEMFLTPLAFLKIATKTSYLYLAIKKNSTFDPHTEIVKKQAARIILAKASLDFGIEVFRWSFYFAGIASGTVYPAIFTLATLGIVSNSLGLIKHLWPVKERAQSYPQTNRPLA